MGEIEQASVMTQYMPYFNGLRFIILSPVYIISIIRVKKFLYLRSWAFFILEVLVVYIGAGNAKAYSGRGICRMVSCKIVFTR